MVTTVRGFGNVGVRTDDNKFLPLGATTFTLTSEVTFEDVDGRPLTSCGDAEILDTVQSGPEVYTLTLGAKKLDRLQFEFFATGAKRDTKATIVVPTPKSFTVPTTGIIPVADMDTDQVAYVTILSDTSPGNNYLTQQNSGTGVTVTAFEAGAGTITVDTSFGGSEAFVWYSEEVANLESIGGTSAINKYDSIEVYGSVCGNVAGQMNIHIPEAKNTSGVALNATLEEQTKAFRPVVASARGMKAVYHMW